TLADNTSRSLITSTKDAVDFVTIAANRAIREGEIRLFARQISIHHEQQIFRPRRDAGLKHAIEHWPNSRPDLLPTIPARSAQPTRMLRRTEDGNVAVVVEHRVLGMAPPDHDGIARADADRDGGLQALRPFGNWANRAAGPVERAHAFAHFAAATQKAQIARGGSGRMF